MSNSTESAAGYESDDTGPVLTPTKKRALVVYSSDEEENGYERLTIPSTKVEEEDDHQNSTISSSPTSSLSELSSLSDDEGSVNSTGSDTSANSEDNVNTLDFEEGVDWVVKNHYIRHHGYRERIEEVELSKSGQKILNLLVASRSFRSRFARNNSELALGILDRLVVVYLPCSQADKRRMLKNAILRYTRGRLTHINRRAQDNAWNHYAVYWCFSDEGLEWMKKLRRLPWNGSAASLEGHPPINIREDISPETQASWTSKEAVRTVLKEVLHAVDVDEMLEDGEEEEGSVWAKIAQTQTLHLIQHQCGVIFTLTRGKIPSDGDDIDRAIDKFTKMKQGRPAILTAEFFEVLDLRITEILEEHGAAEDCFPTLNFA